MLSGTSTACSAGISRARRTPISSVCRCVRWKMHKCAGAGLSVVWERHVQGRRARLFFNPCLVQAFYTNAVQALEALARDEADSTRPLKSNEGARDVMVACHERMRAEGIVPSIEAYNIFVTAVRAPYCLLPHSGRKSASFDACQRGAPKQPRTDAVSAVCGPPSSRLGSGCSTCSVWSR